MNLSALTLRDDEFLDMFEAALQADKNDEALYGWMAEEIDQLEGRDLADVFRHEEPGHGSRKPS